MDYILSLSYGKDSLACLGAIEKLGWPLDRIVHVEIWATDTIPADLPPMVEFIEKADGIIKERYGIAVEHIRSHLTAEDCFYRKRIRGNRVGEIVGWPRTKGCEWMSYLKRTPLNKIELNNITYIGICADEPQRFHNITDIKLSPLVEAGWTSSDCRKWCEENDLLSPIYTTSTRWGCFFCPQQSLGSLRKLRSDFPDYWAIMLKWDADSPTNFKANGHTLWDYERRFQMEDQGIIPVDHKFKWSMINEEDTGNG